MVTTASYCGKRELPPLGRTPELFCNRLADEFRYGNTTAVYFAIKSRGEIFRETDSNAPHRW